MEGKFSAALAPSLAPQGPLPTKILILEDRVADGVETRQISAAKLATGGRLWESVRALFRW